MGAKHYTLQLTIKQDDDGTGTKRNPAAVNMEGEGKSIKTSVEGELYPSELDMVNDLVQRLKCGNDKPKKKTEPDGNKQ